MGPWGLGCVMAGEWRINWTVGSKDLEGLTPAKGRDMLVQAFLAMRGEAIARTHDWSAAQPAPIEVALSAEAIVHEKFDSLGYRWDSPDPSDIGAVAEALAAETVIHGMQPEIVERHLGQIRKVQERLAFSANNH